ncbi:Protein of unknown function [Gryllus bimaculatus]|nr:Protein of unknown function [Gryllus bimaculatus]
MKCNPNFALQIWQIPHCASASGGWRVAVFPSGAGVGVGGRPAHPSPPRARCAPLPPKSQPARAARSSRLVVAVGVRTPLDAVAAVQRPALVFCCHFVATAFFQDAVRKTRLRKRKIGAGISGLEFAHRSKDSALVWDNSQPPGFQMLPTVHLAGGGPEREYKGPPNGTAAPTQSPRIGGGGAGAGGGGRGPHPGARVERPHHPIHPRVTRRPAHLTPSPAASLCSAQSPRAPTTYPSSPLTHAQPSQHPHSTTARFRPTPAHTARRSRPTLGASRQI